LPENPLVPAKRRQQILETVFPLEEAKRERVVPSAVEYATSERFGASQPLRLVLLAAILGTAVAAVGIVQSGASHKTNVVTIAAIFGVTLAVSALLATVLASRSGSSLLGVPSPEARDQLSRLTTYPDEADGLRSLKVLDCLTPIAVAAFAEFAIDEERSLREGLVRGGFIRAGGTPWFKELAEAELLEHQGAPPGLDAKGHEFMVLTDAGRVVARVILPRESVPGWLVSALKSREKSSVDASGGNGSRASSTTTARE
jgi:hypothetical protein